MLGKVKFFADAKGYGFLTGEDSVDYFVHHSEIQGVSTGRRTLKDGQAVEFTPAKGDKGMKATKVWAK